MKRADGPGLEAWRGSWSPREIAARLDGLDVAWSVIGGWAIDLWLGRQTREHGDLEVTIPRHDLPLIRARFAGFRFYAVGDGEVIADGDVSDKHQVWVEEAQLWRVDVMLEPGDADTWVFRRDERIRRPRREMIAWSDGIPYLRPEAVLLFKAKAMRPKDEADFALVAPTIAPSVRAWLRETLAQVHPGHPWIQALG